MLKILNLFKRKETKPPSVVEQAAASLYPAIHVPFNGKTLLVIAKRLSHVEIETCKHGGSSFIETTQDMVDRETKGAPTYADQVKYMEFQHDAVKLSIGKTLYTEFIDMCNAHTDGEKISKKMDEIQELFDQQEDKFSKEALKYEEEYSKEELIFFYNIPSDFIHAVFRHALGLDESDIRLVNEDMLYKAALRAKHTGDNVCDHIHGRFFPRDKEDINSRGNVILFEKEKERKNKVSGY